VESVTEALGILLRDGEDAVAALSASGPAGEMKPAAVNGRGQGGVHDLDKGWRHVLRRSIRLAWRLSSYRFSSTKKIEAL
jgi:hypothetical protein